jgi:hypothetical protein
MYNMRKRRRIFKQMLGSMVVKMWTGFNTRRILSGEKLL